MKTKIIYKLILLIPCLLAIANLGFSQTSLEHLIRQMNVQNPMLQALEKDYEAALEQIDQVSQLPDPQLSTNAMISPVQTRLGAQWLGFGLSQELPWKGLLQARGQVKFAQAKSKFEAIEQDRLKLQNELRDAWLSLYSMEAHQRILADQLTLHYELEKQALAKVETDQASTVDVLNIQLQIQNLRQQIDLLDNDKLIPIAHINLLLDREMAMPIVIVEELYLSQNPFDEAYLMEQILQSHPDLLQMDIAKEIAASELKLNRYEGRPSFEVGVNYLLVSKREDENPSGNGRDIFGPSARLNLPLNRNKYKAKFREENLKLEAINKRKYALRTEIEAMVHHAFTALESARIKYDHYNRQIQTTKAIIEIRETQYSTAGVELESLLDLYNKLLEFESKKLEAIVESHQSKQKIEGLIPLK